MPTLVHYMYTPVCHVCFVDLLIIKTSPSPVCCVLCADEFDEFDGQVEVEGRSRKEYCIQKNWLIPRCTFNNIVFLSINISSSTKNQH